MSQLSSSRLEVRDLELWRGERRLVRGLSFEIPAGRGLIVRGPNGCGKTTLLRTVAGFGLADEGELLWWDRAVARAEPAWRTRVAWLGHREGIKPGLTPGENLAAWAGINDIPVSVDRINRALSDWGIARQRDLPCRQLSAGQRRRTALARLSLAERPLWVLDEPLTSLDTAGIRLVEDRIGRHLDGGGLVLMSSHQPLDVPGRNLQSIELGGEG